MDTIFALSTAPGRAGVAIVRVSGPGVRDAVLLAVGVVPAPRVATLRTFRDRDGAIVDRCLVLFFPAPHSYTGEDVAEFHVHGGQSTKAAVLEFLGKIDDFRLAEPGEFTRRALENGRMDLSEVEGLSDLIDAETDAQRRQAQRLMDGTFRKSVEQWRRDLLSVLSLLAVSIDFADEEIPDDVSNSAIQKLKEMCSSLEREIEGVNVAERLRSGFEVAIVGPPNAGKSTLINYLAGREAAITSEIAGTTRDVIEVKLDLNGLPVIFLDMAGMHDSSDDLERLGIERAFARAKRADLRIFLGESGDGVSKLRGPMDLVFSAKADVSGDADGISGKTGYGVEYLLAKVSHIFEARVTEIGSAVNTRHQASLTLALQCLRKALVFVESDDVELASEEIRQANLSMSSALGLIGIEDVLGEVFSGFCIGK